LARRIMIPPTSMMRIVQSLTSRKLAALSQRVKGIQVNDDGL
jgi:hypothetical protein